MTTERTRPGMPAGSPRAFDGIISRTSDRGSPVVRVAIPEDLGHWRRVRCEFKPVDLHAPGSPDPTDCSPVSIRPDAANPSNDCTRARCRPLGRLLGVRPRREHLHHSRNGIRVWLDGVPVYAVADMVHDACRTGAVPLDSMRSSWHDGRPTRRFTEILKPYRPAYRDPSERAVPDPASRQGGQADRAKRTRTVA